jgi:hypothetical protein
MITLPNDIRKNGFSYKQVLRGDRSCIYEQRVGQKIIAFEVFMIRVMQEKSFMGKIFKEREIFPSNEDFGKTAWTYWTIEEAMVKYLKLEIYGNLKRQWIR